MRHVLAVAGMVGVALLPACPEDKPIDLSRAQPASATMPLAKRMAAPRATMPEGALPFTLPVVANPSVPTLALAPELMIFDDNKVIRHATSTPNPYQGTPAPYTSSATTTIGVAAQLDDRPGTLALFLNTAGSATQALYVLDDLKLERVALAMDMPGFRGQLGYLFGTGTVAVRDRFQLDLRRDNLTFGTTEMVGWIEIGAQLPTLVAAQRGPSNVGLEARIGVGSGTTVFQLVTLLDMLAEENVESVFLSSVTDSVAHSTTGLRERGGAIPTVSIGHPNVQGDLDKAIIRRYIKRNIAKLQYCYEKELLVDGNLAGTVSTQFFIAPTGIVAQSTASGVSTHVSTCVASVIREIEFPKPKGGGGAQVNYPLTFLPAGG